MKKTAVEWLEEQLDNLLELHHSEFVELIKVIDKAKEKEYRQITNAYESGIFDGFNRKSKDYYNETFKQQEKDIEF